MSKTGVIYNIQRYSLHDGPGIRTVVFFKGCPLRCRWCCNPESQDRHPEISYVRSKCIGLNACGLCAKVCDFDAIGTDGQGRAAINRSKCANCLCCAGNCPAKAIRVEGLAVTAAEALDEAEKEAVFYRNGGGITVSGGEPLMQSDFLLEILEEAKRRKINAAMETCGFGDYSVLKRAAPLLDTILYDIKSMDAEKHKAWTGQSNTLILENFNRLCVDFPDLRKIVRTPVIPGFNDSEKDPANIRSFLRDRPNVDFEELPYHRFGVGKYEALGRKYTV